MGNKNMLDKQKEKEINKTKHTHKMLNDDEGFMSQ